MKDFKVGDKIRLVRDFGGLSKGDEFLVTSKRAIDKIFWIAKGECTLAVNHSWNRHMFELVEESKMQNQFTKADLKTWMRVVTRAGRSYIVDTEHEILLGDGGYLDLNDMDEFLFSMNEYPWDIIEVYNSPKSTKYMMLDPSFKGQLLWKQKEKSKEQIEAEEITKEIESLKQRLEELSKKI